MCCFLLFSNEVENEHVWISCRTNSHMKTKSQSCSQLIGFKRFKIYHFVVTRDLLLSYLQICESCKFSKHCRCFSYKYVRLPVKGLIKNTFCQPIHVSNSEMPGTCKAHQC